MIKLFTSLWVCSILGLSGTIPIPPYSDDVNGNWTEELKALFHPEDTGNSRDEPFYTLGEPEGREKRETDLDDLDSPSFEVPTVVRVNDSRNPELQGPLSCLSNYRGDRVSANTGGGCQTRKPIHLTLMIENVLPPGRSDKFAISNSSEIRGCGVLFKMSICETRTTTCCPNDLAFNVDMNSLDRTSDSIDSLESRTRKSSHGEVVKNDEEEEEEEDVTDQKTIQEILKKILSSGNANSTTQVPLEELSSILKNSVEPITLVVKPSVLQKLSPKPKSSSQRTFLSHSKSPNPPDHESLTKLVEQLSTNLTKSKLVSLLSNLVAKMSSDTNR